MHRSTRFLSCPATWTYYIPKVPILNVQLIPVTTLLRIESGLDRWCIHTYSPGHAGSRGPLHPTVGVSDKTRLLRHSHRKLPSLTYAQCHLLLPRVLSPPPVPASPSSTNQPTNPQNPRRNHAAPPCSASPPASPYARSSSPRRRRRHLHRPPTPPGSTPPGSPRPAPSVPRLWPA